MLCVADLEALLAGLGRLGLPLPQPVLQVRASHMLRSASQPASQGCQAGPGCQAGVGRWSRGLPTPPRLHDHAGMLPSPPAS